MPPRGQRVAVLFSPSVPLMCTLGSRPSATPLTLVLLLCLFPTVPQNLLTNTTVPTAAWLISILRRTKTPRSFVPYSPGLGHFRISTFRRTRNLGSKRWRTPGLGSRTGPSRAPAVASEVRVHPGRTPRRRPLASSLSPDMQGALGQRGHMPFVPTSTSPTL